MRLMAYSYIKMHKTSLKLEVQSTVHILVNIYSSRLTRYFMHAERMSCMIGCVCVSCCVTLSCPICLLLLAVDPTSEACQYSNPQETILPLATQSFMPHTGRPPKPPPLPTAVATPALPEGMDKEAEANRWKEVENMVDLIYSTQGSGTIQIKCYRVLNLFTE